MQFFTGGHLKDQTILCFDTEKGRTQPQGPWAETALSADTWDVETLELAENENFRMLLADVYALQEHKMGGCGQSKGGVNTFLAECSGEQGPSSSHCIQLKWGKKLGLWNSAECKV